MESLNLGPFAFPVGLILFLGAVLATFFAGYRVANRLGTNVDRALWSILFVGVGSGRLAFVLIYWRNYADSPWAAFDIRDGGMNTTVGIAGALLMAILLAIRDRAWRRPLLASMLVGLTSWGGMTAALQAGRAPASVPALTLSTLDGQTLALQSLAGKPVVINLWASWCPPCRREMPVLREAQAAHDDIVFIFANQGETAKAVRAYVDAQAPGLANVLLDTTGSIAKHVGTAGLPATLFFDRYGSLVETRIGELSRASLAQRLKPLQQK